MGKSRLIGPDSSQEMTILGPAARAAEEKATDRLADAMYSVVGLRDMVTQRTSNNDVMFANKILNSMREQFTIKVEDKEVVKKFGKIRIELDQWAITIVESSDHDYMRTGIRASINRLDGSKSEKFAKYGTVYDADSIAELADYIISKMGDMLYRYMIDLAEEENNG